MSSHRPSTLQASLIAIALAAGLQFAQIPDALAQSGLPSVDAQVSAIAAKVIDWRRDIHRNPELGNQETRTATLVADHLRSLGFDEVRTGVGVTGVVGILKGNRPGRIVALRADMDALPIKEATGLPFASTVTVRDGDKEVPVMHACGHDAHTAMLMGAAEILASRRDNIQGTVMFIFQPAEEGVSGSETAGAQLMIEQGIFATEKPDAIFALHVEPGPAGQIQTRSGPLLSSASNIHIELKGRQTHAGRPWEGNDLVSLSADIVKSLATISSRQVNVFEFPNVVSIGSLQAGTRGNILPGTAEMHGTIRTFDLERRDRLKDLITKSVNGLSASYEAQGVVTFKDSALVTGSDPALLEIIMPALEKAASAGVDKNTLLRGAAEDFSYFEEKIPGVYYILASTKNFTSMEVAPTNHSDLFDIDESVLSVGVKAHVLSAIAFLNSTAGK